VTVLTADLLLTDATFLTVDPLRPRASWLAVRDGRIVALGDAEDRPAARRTLRLDGATVVPGFHDAHVHTVHVGKSLTSIELRYPHVGSMEELYDAVRAAVERTPTGGWIFGENYDQNKLGGHPDIEVLDRIAPDHLVRLGHNSRHMCFVNSRVVEALGLHGAADPTGGRVDRRPDGRPSGLLLESAMELLRPLTWPIPLDTMVDYIAAAQEQYVREGVTAVQEAGIGDGLAGSSPVEALAFQQARDKGALLVRTTLMPAYAGAGPLPGAAGDRAYGFGLGLRTGFGDTWLRLGPLKVFSDGSLIGRSAAMKDGFTDDPCNHGMLALAEGELERIILDAHVGGWQVATHAIGDRAVDAAIEAYAAALEALPRHDHRHRIEHAGIAGDAAVARMAALGLIPDPQGRFIGELGDGMIAALGPERVHHCYRGRSLLDAGIELPGSSDRPVVDGAPLRGIHDMVNRRTDSGQDFAVEEALTAAEALRAYTYGSAHAAFLEQQMGSLAPGRLADLAVLSDDLTRVAPQRIRDIEVLATVIEGRFAFDSAGQWRHDTDQHAGGRDTRCS
jgi:predicted amidohydrolase YtcJ